MLIYQNCEAQLQGADNSAPSRKVVQPCCCYLCQVGHLVAQGADDAGMHKSRLRQEALLLRGSTIQHVTCLECLQRCMLGTDMRETLLICHTTHVRHTFDKQYLRLSCPHTHLSKAIQDVMSTWCMIAPCKGIAMQSRNVANDPWLQSQHPCDLAETYMPLQSQHKHYWFWPCCWG